MQTGIKNCGKSLGWRSVPALIAAAGMWCVWASAALAATLGQSLPADSAAVPAIPERSTLPSLASAKGDEEKCDVLLKWLETAKASAPPSRGGTMLPAEEIAVFRDDSMLAVFGRRYDDLDNRQRIDLMEKVVGKCTGEARPEPRQPMPRPSIRIGGMDLGRLSANAGARPRPLPREYAEEFRPYGELLHEAFGGRPGRFEPAAIMRYLGQVRQQIAWLNAALSSAASTGVSAAAFLKLEEARGGMDKGASLLRTEERNTARQYLERKESEMAPDVTRAWLANAEKDRKDLEAAQRLEEGHRQMSGVLARLDGAQKNSAEQDYNRLLNRDIAESVHAETAKVHATPATWQGAQQLASTEAELQRMFGAFSGTPSFQAGISAIAKERERVLPAVLPAWERKVAATAVQDSDLDARKQDLQTLFPAPADRSSDLYARFEKPLLTKRNELKAKAEAEVRGKEQARIAAEQKALSQVANVQLPRASGPASKSDDQDGEGGVLVFPLMVKALFAGNLAVIPDDQLFRSYFLSVARGITDTCTTSGPLDMMCCTPVRYPMFQAGGASPAEMGLKVLQGTIQTSLNVAQATTTGGMLDAVRNSQLPDSGLIREGVMDGETVVNTWKCNTATNLKIRASLSRLFEERKGHKPEPSDQKRFYTMMNPEYRQILQNSVGKN